MLSWGSRRIFYGGIFFIFDPINPRVKQVSPYTQLFYDIEQFF